jgi:2-haloacid dehalogenase
MKAQIDRRGFLRASGAGTAAFLLPNFTPGSNRPAKTSSAARGGTDDTSGKAAPKALVFDTFGTIVDWRGSIIAEGAVWGKEKGLNIDWGHFADRWRAGYGPAMAKVRSGELPWTKLDVLHRMILEDVLKEFNITGLTEEEKQDWTFVWHRLKPWPDSVSGLARLKTKYMIAPLSNGNVSLLADMAKREGLPWDLILSAELAKHYKPDRESYLTAVELLSLKPEKVMMVAAHVQDLNAARSFGLRTGFIYRPNEYGPGHKADHPTPDQYDVVSEDAIDLASKMGC